VNELAPVIKKEFVAVAVNQFNESNRLADGANGDYLASLGAGPGNIFSISTADGKSLGGFFMNGVNGTGEEQLFEGLKKWQALPESERKPKDLKLGEKAKASPVAPPAGGLVLREYIRNLKRESGGGLGRITKKDLQDRQKFPEVWTWGNGIAAEPVPDTVWLTEVEWKSLVPAAPKKGDAYEIPAPIRMRIFRYHLCNSTLGLAAPWPLACIHKGRLTLTVEETSPLLRMRLDGSVLLGEVPKGDEPYGGYEAKLAGAVVYDPKEGAFTRFDFVAVRDEEMEKGIWQRPGRNPLGFAFELARGRGAMDLIPPWGLQVKKEPDSRYFAADK
jgi:hypothetical protein